MHSKFDNTVSELSPFFSPLNLFGFITLYFYLRIYNSNDQILSAQEIINTILFVLIDIVYIISIYSVNNNNENISDILKSSSVIATLFEKKKINNISYQTTNRMISKPLTVRNYNTYRSKQYSNINSDNTAIMNQQNDIIMTQKEILTRVISNDQTSDWLVLQKIVGQKWKTFSIFGVELNDTELISRFSGIVIAILIGTQIGDMAESI